MTRKRRLFLLCAAMASILWTGAAVSSSEAEVSQTAATTLRISEVLAEDTARVEAGRLLILGSPHLAQEFSDDFDPAWLDRLHEVLEDFAPAVIGIEVLRPQDILSKRHLDDRRDDWDQVLNMFASGIIARAESVRDSSDMNWADARRQQQQLLAQTQSEEFDAKQRRKLIAASLAAYDLHTGLLHWAHLAETDRKAGQGLSEDSVEALNRALDSSNEANQLGVRLAAQLGLQRIHQIDDQLSLGIQSMQEHQKLGKLVQESGIQAEVQAQYEGATAEALALLQEDGDLLPLYRQLNSDDYAAFDIGTQWAAFFDERLDENLARTRMARRESRDLSIAANIRQASARYPGQDMLVIIGASHRPFLESYLSDMTDLEIIQLGDLLED